MRETPRAAAAFADYCAMGPGRSLRKLADKTGTKLAQLGQWSTRFAWQERITAYDQQRADDRAKRREAQREAMEDRQARIAREQLEIATQRTRELAEAGALNDRAAVQLLKTAADLERTALGAPASVERHEMTGKDGAPIAHSVSAVDWRAVQLTLVQALAPYPDARLAVAEALAQLEAAHAVPPEDRTEQQGSRSA